MRKTDEQIEKGMQFLQPLVHAIAQETAKLVLLSLGDSSGTKGASEVKWGDTKCAAAHLKMTPGALLQARSKGKVPAHCYKTNLGKNYRWDLVALDRWLETTEDD